MGNGAALSGLRFDEYLMAEFAKRGDHAGDAADTSFVIFDLFGYSDDHCRFL